MQKLYIFGSREHRSEVLTFTRWLETCGVSRKNIVRSNALMFKPRYFTPIFFYAVVIPRDRPVLYVYNRDGAVLEPDDAAAVALSIGVKRAGVPLAIVFYEYRQHWLLDPRYADGFATTPKELLPYLQ